MQKNVKIWFRFLLIIWDFLLRFLVGITSGINLFNLALLLLSWRFLVQLAKASRNFAIQLNKLCCLRKRQIKSNQTSTRPTCRADQRVVLVSLAALARSAKAPPRSKTSSVCGGSDGGGQGILKIYLFKTIFSLLKVWSTYPKTSLRRRSWTQRTQSSHFVRLVWTPGKSNVSEKDIPKKNLWRLTKSLTVFFERKEQRFAENTFLGCPSKTMFYF